MNMYVVNLILIFIYACVFLWNPRVKKGKLWFCFFSATNWILLSGLRGLDVGADTREYKEFFWDFCLNHYSWEFVINMFVDKFFSGVGMLSQDSALDPGYFLLLKFIQIFTDNYQVFLLLVAIAFMIPFSCWVYRESKEPFISFLIYSCLFYEFFSITGIRQVVGTALVFFAGNKFYKEKKYGHLLVTIILAFLVHKSIICYIPFFVIREIKITKIYTVFCLGLTVFAFALKDTIFYILCTVFGYQKYLAPEEAGTWTFTFMLVVVTMLALLYKKKIFALDNNATSSYNALFMALVLTALTFVDPSAMRAVQYYSLYLVLILPDIVVAQKGVEKYIVGVGMSLMMVFLVLKDNPQYLFCWQ